MCFAVLDLFGHSKPTVVNRAAVPVALTGVQIAGEYLNASGTRLSGPTVAPTRTGRHGAVCRVVVRGRIERRIGLGVANVGRLVGRRSERAAPIAVADEREDGSRSVAVGRDRRRDAWRLDSALADSLFDRQVLWRLDGLKILAIITRHGVLLVRIQKQNKSIGSNFFPSFTPLSHTHTKTGISHYACG